MMNILEKAQVFETHIQKMDGFIPTSTAMARADVRDITPPDEIYHKSQFVIELTVACSFYTNKAEYDEAVKIAGKKLLYCIYDNIIPMINDAKGAVYDGEPKEVLYHLECIEKELGLQ